MFYAMQCGMVAWRLVLSTPEFPEGRELVLIANDLTYFIGSFGPQEDFLFNKASILARELKVPRVSASIIQNLVFSVLERCTDDFNLWLFVDLHCMQQWCAYWFG